MDIDIYPNKQLTNQENFNLKQMSWIVHKIKSADRTSISVVNGIVIRP